MVCNRLVDTERSRALAPRVGARARGQRCWTVRGFGVLSLVASFAGACGETSADAEPGALRVILEPEDTILDGLEPGEGVEAIRDGWRVTYSKYVIAIGNVRLDYATDRDVIATDERTYAVDLLQVPSSGETLWDLDGLRPGRWNFGFQLTGGAHGPKRHESVSKADYTRVVDEDLTYLIVGTLTKEDGMSCPPAKHLANSEREAEGENEGGDACYANPSIDFEFAVTAETGFGNCELDGVAGIAITSATTVTDAITIHGDHLFFNGFPSGDEGGIVRLGQLWADVDLNLDGKIDVGEFGDVWLADLPEWNERYQLGGAPQVGELNTLGDIAIAELKTQGHMNGEGECEIDGQAHADHD